MKECFTVPQFRLFLQVRDSGDGGYRAGQERMSNSARTGPKVALIYTLFNSPTQPYLANALDRMRKAGVEADVYSRHAPASRGRMDFGVLQGPSGLRALCSLVQDCMRRPVEVARWLKVLGRTELRSGVRRWLDLKSLLSRNYDVIHLHNWPLYALLRPYLRESRIPFVISFRGYDLNLKPRIDPDWREEVQSIFREAAVVHCVSEFLRRQALELGADPEKTVVIRPCVDIDWLNAAGRTERNPEVLRVASTGRLTWEKAFELSFQIIRELRRRAIPVEYHVAGDGTERLKLEFWAAQLGVSDVVVWHGLVGQERLRELFAAADVYLHPAVSEAFGVAVLEAQAAGLPVVATRIGGIPEAVRDGETGFLFDFGDVRGMADAIERLWREPELADWMGQAGKRLIQEQHSPDAEVVAWERVYRRAAGGYQAADRGGGSTIA